MKRTANRRWSLHQGSEQQFNAEGVLTFTTYDEYMSSDLTPYINTEEDGVTSKIQTAICTSC